MVRILSNIITLAQYITVILERSFDFDQERICPSCGKQGLWRHGCYARKADRSTASDLSLNPLQIQRYYCPNCQKTCSILPECLPPRRWYLWKVQQVALILLLAGKSLRSTARSMMPSRRTLSRWINRFREQLLFHKAALCTHIIEVGPTISLADFWQACLSHCSLAKAMQLCHVAGVSVP
jgi:transposase-like protein